MEIISKNSYLTQTDFIRLQLLSKEFYRLLEKTIEFCEVKFESWEEEPTAFY